MTEPSFGPGKQLRAERESLGVSVREVADTLNLSITVIQALEADDYDRLPGTVFARGYIRAYARLLELDPAPLLERFPGQALGVEAQPVNHDNSLAEWIRGRPALVLSGLTALILAILLGLTALLWPEDGFDTLLAPVAEPGLSLPSGVAGSDPAGAVGDESVLTERMGDAVTTGEEVGPDTGWAAQVVEGEPLESADGLVARRISPNGEQRLRLEFPATTRVEVRDKAGTSVLYSNTAQAGTTLELVGEAPFRIRLDPAPGVVLTLDGEPVALAPHTRNNVANLTLGQ